MLRDILMLRGNNGLRVLKSLLLNLLNPKSGIQIPKAKLMDNPYQNKNKAKTVKYTNNATIKMFR